MHLGLRFQYTHDLDELLRWLARTGVKIPDNVMEAITLTIYAWEARYPGLNEEVTEGEYQEAVVLAEHVAAWAEEIIAR